jgi:hypothetical protein
MEGKKKSVQSKAKPKGKTVDGYIASLKGWQAEAVSTLRKIIRDAAPKAAESIKWGQPVYEEGGPLCYVKAFKDYVALGFWRGTEVADPKGILGGSGDRMRHVKLYGLKDINKNVFQSMVRSAVKLNRFLGDPTKRRK